MHTNLKSLKYFAITDKKYITENARDYMNLKDKITTT